MKNAADYQPTKMRPILQIAAEMIRRDATLLDERDLGRLRAMLKREIPELADPSKCANCGASMKAQKPKIDYHIVLLVQSMARLVRERVDKGMPFTDANKTHVNAEDRIPHVSRNKTTQAAKLGLIARVSNKSAYWSVTTRGWAALRGERVPAQVVMFRRKIIEHLPDTITFREAIANSTKKTIGSAGYDPKEWIDFGDNQPGKLL